MTESKAQHWVPQFYLKPFCSAEDPNRIWVFFREGPDEPRLMRPEEVCAQNYLYTPLGDDGSRDRSIDDKLSGLETVIGGIWPAVATSAVDLSKDSTRKALALFVATLWLRNPQRIEGTRRFEEYVREFLRPIPYEGKADLSPLTGQQLKAAFANQILANGRPIAESLLRKRWTIVVSDEPVFATCDVPVQVTGGRGALLPPLASDSTVTLPLSPTRYLVIKARDELPDGYYGGTDEFYQAVNHQTWLAADRYLLSREESHGVLRQIMAFADTHGFGLPGSEPT